MILPHPARVGERAREEPLTTPARSTIAVTLIGALALIVSGCGETVIDDQKTEGAVKASLERSLHEKIKSVDCPTDEEVDPGNSFSCAVDFPEGEEATATLKILDKEADVRLVGLEANKSKPSNASE